MIFLHIQIFNIPPTGTLPAKVPHEQYAHFPTRPLERSEHGVKDVTTAVMSTDTAPITHVATALNAAAMKQ